ncbi:MAG: HEAT repeat domain-containing protein [Planctomycetota bacterium]|jgi:hypothetical protein
MNKAEIKRLAKTLRIRRDAIDHERILASARAALKSAEGTSSEELSGRTRGRTISTNRRARFAAVAVLILALCAGAAYWLVQRPSGVAIPAELARMGRRELFNLYVKGSESFNKAIVAAAMKKSFEGVCRDDLSVPVGRHAQDGGRNEGNRRGFASLRERGDDPRLAVSLIVEACDLIAQVRIGHLMLDEDDLTAALLDKYIDDYIDKGISETQADGLSVDSEFRDGLRRECVDALAVDFPNIDFSASDLGQRIRAEVGLHIIKACPPASVADKLLIRPVFDLERLDRWEEGREYLIALKHHEGLFWLLPENQGVFAVDTGGATVRGIIREEIRQQSNRSTRRGRAEPTASGQSDDQDDSEQLRTAIAFEEAWVFIADMYDAIHEGRQPSGDVLDYWVAKLQSDSLIESWMALEYFSTLRSAAVAPGAVVEAVERHLTNPPANYDPDSVSSFQRTAFLVDAIRVLILCGDESAVDRILTLYKQTLSSSEEGFYEIRELKDDLIEKLLRLSLKLPGPVRRERFLRVFSAILGSGEPSIEHDLQVVLPDMLACIEGEDIDRLVWDIVREPAAFDIKDIGILQGIWTAAALRALPEFGAYLDDILADPNSASVRLSEESDVRTKDVVGLAQHAMRAYIVAAEGKGLIERTEAIRLLIDQYRWGNASLRYSNHSIIVSIANLIEPTDRQFIPFFAEVLSGRGGSGDLTGIVPIVLLAERMFDPSLIPAVKAAPGGKVSGKLLEILYFSGAKEESVSMALSVLEKLVNDDPDWRTSVRKWYEFEDLALLISFLGTTEEAKFAAVIDQFVGGETFERLKKEYADGAIELQLAAVLALGRLGDASAIPRLKQLYASGDTYIRILAGWSLFHLGDDTGSEMIAHFVNHTERSQPDIEMHWDGHYACDGLFRLPLMYLVSPQGEALLLESLHNLDHGFGTNRYLGNYGYGYAFLKKHKHKVLPIVVEHLDNTNRKARESANSLLKDLTGRDFGFCMDRFPGQQDEIIERWRAYVDEYLKRYE